MNLFSPHLSRYIKQRFQLVAINVVLVFRKRKTLTLKIFGIVKINGIPLNTISKVALVNKCRIKRLHEICSILVLRHRLTFVTEHTTVGSYKRYCEPQLHLLSVCGSILLVAQFYLSTELFALHSPQNHRTLCIGNREAIV